jgi:hypothetical protein
VSFRNREGEIEIRPAITAAALVGSSASGGDRCIVSRDVDELFSHRFPVFGTEHLRFNPCHAS